MKDPQDARNVIYQEQQDRDLSQKIGRRRGMGTTVTISSTQREPVIASTAAGSVSVGSDELVVFEGSGYGKSNVTTDERLKACAHELVGGVRPAPGGGNVAFAKLSGGSTFRSDIELDFDSSGMALTENDIAIAYGNGFVEQVGNARSLTKKSLYALRERRTQA